ncbi:MAG: hypothetical protein WBP55_12065 [Solirubrobacterales bacterium]
MKDGSVSKMLRRRPWELALGFLMLASATLLLTVRAKLDFMLDDWAFVISRAPGNIGDYLEPHNEHISILPVAIYKLLLGIFGMTSAMPLHVLSVALFLLSVWVLFVYLKPLAGAPAAFIGCGLVLFLGTAWEDLLWVFQLGFSISLAAGIGSLHLLRRGDRAGDRLACLLLVISVISTSIGIAFIAAALVALLLRRSELVKRLWVVAVPSLVYATWWIGWGRDAPNGFRLENTLDVPLWVFNALRLAIADTNGSFRIAGETGEIVTAIACFLVLAGLAFCLYRSHRIPRAFLVALALGLVFWGLAALNGRNYEAVRYQLPGVMILLMLVAGAIDGVRIPSRVLGVVAVVAVVGVSFNLVEMQDGYRNFFHPLSDKGFATLTALEIARGSVDPDYAAGMNEDGSLAVTARDYFDAEQRYGSAAWSLDEIGQRSGEARARVDQVLVEALPVSGVPLPSGLNVGSCQKVAAGTAGSETTIPLPARTFTFRSDNEVFLAVGRYGDGAATGAIYADADTETLVRVPEDRSTRPWRISFLGTGTVRVCGVLAKG